jgi:hypothetical protein
MELTLEKFTQLKKDYLDMIVEGTKEAGGLPPHLTLFGYHKEEQDKQAIIHVPITDDLMTPEGKEKLFELVIPKLAEKVTENFHIFGLAWASEAWVREAGAEKPVGENWRDIPIKKEVIIINLESTVKNEFIMFDMLRKGHRINDEGKMIDNVELIEVANENVTSAGGNIMGLLKQFLKAEN